MENLTEKLNTFASIVLKDASQKRDEMLKAVEREHEVKLTEKENEFLQEAYEEIQHSVAEARKHSNQKVLHEELEAKKQLLIAREKIIADIMDTAAAKLKEFASGDKYEKWLLDKTEKSLFEVGDGAKTVYISSDDLKYKDKIESLENGKITVEAAAEHDFAGGVRVCNTDRRIAVDYSFKELLSEQRGAFLRSSGLSIN